MSVHLSKNSLGNTWVVLGVLYEGKEAMSHGE